MADEPSKQPRQIAGSPRKDQAADREARLSAALRQNLRRRKAQRDARTSDAPSGETGQRFEKDRG